MRLEAKEPAPRPSGSRPAGQPVRDLRRTTLRFVADRHGVVALMFAILLPVLIGFAILAIDMSYGFVSRNELQVTASAAALAGASQLIDETAPAGTPDNSDYRTIAVEFAYKNMPEARHGRVVEPICGTFDPISGTVSSSIECTDVKAGYWNTGARSFTAWTDGSFDPSIMDLNAVRVMTRKSTLNGNELDLFLASFLGMGSLNVDTPAIAVLGGGSANEACMIALDPSAEKAFHIEGTADLNSDDCGICVNSTDEGGLWANGEPVVNVAAEITVNAAAFVEQGAATISPTPTTNGGACTDPFAGTNPFTTNFEDETCAEGTPATLYDGDDFLAAPAGQVNVPSGLHCGGLSFQANGLVVFEPGLHHIKNGTLLIQGSHSAFGAGITFLIDNATINFGGAQNIDLSAGAGGSEFLFYENPDGPHPTEEHDFRGDANASYEGIIYTPDRNIRFRGETDGGAAPPECFAVIANKFHFTGTTDIQLNSDGCGGALETTSTITLRLVD